MKKLFLPVVESLLASYRVSDFSRVKIIGVQHILETTHSMFRSFYKLGLRPENISIIGKCYSTCREVYNEMIEDGIDVSEDSFTYSSHQSYDDQFNFKVQKFLKSRLNEISSDKYEQVIVLDDGGKCIQCLNKFLHTSFLAAIEQTSSGFEAIRSHSLAFPVVNVARSPIKLDLESPMIARAAAERLYLSLQSGYTFPDRALIIGGGAIGKAMQKRLGKDMDIVIFDQKNNLSDNSLPRLTDIISGFPLIIGCTGKTSIPNQLHHLIAPKSILVSVSSSDREFDAVYLRKNLPLNNLCHTDLYIKDILLVKGGFPVNFDGERENIEPELIQLTIALIAAGILQARGFTHNTPRSILPLALDFEEKIKADFHAFTKEYRHKIE